MVDKGQMKEGPLEYETPVFFMTKKEGTDLYMVVKYWKLNEMTVSEKYYMLDTDTELNKLKGKGLFLKLNIKDGYYNMLIDPKDWHKAGLKTSLRL